MSEALEPIRGRVLKYENADDVNTDVIWPGRYTYVQMPTEEMAQHAMETFDPEFGLKVKNRQVLVVGRNFGCGSSREQAVECLLAAGVRAIVGRSFSRIFFRNCINLGLPAVASPQLVDALQDADTVEIDLASGSVSAPSGQISVPRFPPLLMQILSDGGLIPHVVATRGSHD